ncbi:MAG: hypothetical protein V3T17_02815 [Pseudomonadales bacterium]
MNGSEEISVVNMNFNGDIRIKKPAGMSKAQAEEILHRKFNEALSTCLRELDNGLKCIGIEGEFFTDTGNCQVGNLFFTVDHDVEHENSKVTLDMRPSKEQFGYNRLVSRVITNTTPNEISLASIDPISRMRHDLALLRFTSGKLSLLVADPKAGDLKKNGSHFFHTYDNMVEVVS